jgi:renalase
VDDETTTVVGAGISGVACARVLAAAGVPVRVVDRGRRPGGRMGGRTLHGRPVDLGASYLTAAPGSPFEAVVADWVRRGLAHPWTDTFAVAGPGGLGTTTTGPLRYGTPGGLRSLVVDLARGLTVEPEHPVAAVTPEPAVDGHPAAAVVLAMPDPQAARLLSPDTPVARFLDPGSWQPALAVAMGWPARRWPADLHGAFVHDHHVLQWFADDGDRRGDGAPVLVAHSTAGFAAEHLDDPAAAGPEVVAAVGRLLGVDEEPIWTHVHRWSHARPGDPRDAPFALDGRIGLCGDGWSAPSKVESAWRSGDALGSALVAALR